MHYQQQDLDTEAHCMPADYKIHPYDVLNGRQKVAFNNVGNRRFRVTLTLAVTQYKNASSRSEKSRVIDSIIHLVKQNGGRFLMHRKGQWIDIGHQAAHEKVGHAFRDMVSANTKKTKQAKQVRSVSPFCVAQNIADNVASQPLDVHSEGEIFFIQHASTFWDDFSSDE